MNLRTDIQSFAHELEAQDNAAHDLWTWLPSYQAAKAAHGDYATEHQPNISEVMKEACMVLALAKGSKLSEAEVKQWFGCPCGECAHTEGKLPEDKS